jgi:hypothetical protein
LVDVNRVSSESRCSRECQRLIDTVLLFRSWTSSWART